MCGVIGYIGEKQAEPVLFNALSQLEYRGYDSCGIAVIGKDGIAVCKDAVRIATLAEIAPELRGTTGIGHTRWATCGKPSRENAHPHLDCGGRVAVVHNGVINNYSRLKKELVAAGHKFSSETDTEVIAHLIEKYYSGNFEDAVGKAVRDLEGSYAFIAMMESENELVAVRKDSPLIIGIGDHEKFIASDVPAVLDYTNRIIYLENGDLAVVTKNNIKITQNRVPVIRKEQRTAWSAGDAGRGGYEHFMLKEIHEEPRVITDTLEECLRQEVVPALVPESGRVTPLLFLACGTSYHAGLIGKQLTEAILRLSAQAELASEFIYTGQAGLVSSAIAITQSGETADTLRAMEKVKAAGGRLIAITNVPGSSATRTTDTVLYTRAGPEISVAATKSFIAQLVVLYWLIISQAKINIRVRDGLLQELRQLPGKVQQVLDADDAIKEYAGYLSRFENVFFVGRGLNYPVALEGALKLKEVSYIHAEGYAAGEFKHGAFALLNEKTPVVALLTHDATYDSMMTTLKEIKARGSPVMAVAGENDEVISETADIVLPVPEVNPVLSPVLNTVILQLIAYFTAKYRGCPVDFPRNLAKSVTVE
jgi:glucosamine--fructose-6-phosphate aminotransferase (isomerizing)